MSERGIPKDAAVYRALAHFDAQAYTYLRCACFRRARFRRALRRRRARRRRRRAGRLRRHRVLDTG